MREIIELATQLGRMGIDKCIVEVDEKKYEELDEAVLKYVSSGTFVKSEKHNLNKCKTPRLSIKISDIEISVICYNNLNQ